MNKRTMERNTIPPVFSFLNNSMQTNYCPFSLQITSIYFWYIVDLFTCDFELDECNQYFRIAAPGRYGADIRWQRFRGSTPTELTGPDRDHTRGDQNGMLIMKFVNPV